MSDLEWNAEKVLSCLKSCSYTTQVLAEKPKREDYKTHRLCHFQKNKTRKAMKYLIFETFLKQKVKVNGKREREKLRNSLNKNNMRDWLDMVVSDRENYEYQRFFSMQL
uniref:Uncharacterized protein n=1 Tax=Erpetoichthys calabaricus TaxID=27687 RepID=A0A8C4S1C9_ERPCA